MWRTEQKDNTPANWTDLRCRRTPVGLHALFLLLIVGFACSLRSWLRRRPFPNAGAHCNYALGAYGHHSPEPTATTAPEPTPEAATLDDDSIKRAFVATAIEYYGENGLDATVEHYKSEAGIEGGRPLTLIDAEESVVLVYRALPTLEGQYVGPGSRFSALGRLVTDATEDGLWSTARGINPATKQEEPRRVFVILH